MHHIVKSLLRHARRSMCASARALHPETMTSGLPITAPGLTPVSAAPRLMSTGAGEQSGSKSSEPWDVCSWNEWDPMEEVIVGRAFGHRMPKLDMQRKAGTFPTTWESSIKNAGQPGDPERVEKAEAEAEELVRVLEAEGVKVRRADPWDWNKLGEFKTPYFEEGGFKNCCPRDGILVVGDEIIESAMGMRSRAFEFHPYRKLLMEYWRRGANWTAAPRPTMCDELYDKDFPAEDFDAQEVLLRKWKFSLTEEEIVFEAADCLRFGRDIFVTVTNTTNLAGVEWLRRHLEPKGIRVHKLLFYGQQNNHADATFMPLCEGVIAVAKERPCIAINDRRCGWEYFEERGWKVITLPRGNYSLGRNFGHDVSPWMHVNMLSLDGKRILCQANEPALRDLLITNGFTPIELPMTNAFYLGGAHHCWTCDVRRRGELKDYGLN